MPSAEDATEYQPLLPAAVLSTHVAPESVDVWMYPPLAGATSLVPSAEDASDDQFLLPAVVLSTHVAPESVDV